MTKSGARNAPNADDSFWNKDAELVVREEPEKNRVYDLEVKAQARELWVEARELI
jgi:hypothetical protein